MLVGNGIRGGARQGVVDFLKSPLERRKEKYLPKLMELGQKIMYLMMLKKGKGM